MSDDDLRHDEQNVHGWLHFARGLTPTEFDAAALRHLIAAGLLFAATLLILSPIMQVFDTGGAPIRDRLFIVTNGVSSVVPVAMALAAAGLEAVFGAHRDQRSPGWIITYARSLGVAILASAAYVVVFAALRHPNFDVSAPRAAIAATFSWSFRLEWILQALACGVLAALILLVARRIPTLAIGENAGTPATP